MMENYEDQSWKTIYLGFFKKFLERNIYTHTHKQKSLLLKFVPLGTNLEVPQPSLHIIFQF